MGSIITDILGMGYDEPAPAPEMPDTEEISAEAEEEARKKAATLYGRQDTILTGNIDLGEPSVRIPTLIGS